MKFKKTAFFLTAVFYFVLFHAWVIHGRFPSAYGGDFLAFWSAGRIADIKGYSEIYDLTNLKITQSQELLRLGFLKNSEGTSFSPIPAPLFPFFILPFQLLSKVDPEVGYWIWTFFNFLILTAYLVFFTGRVLPGNKKASFGFSAVVILILSYPVFDNFINGQVQVLLLVCAGEFIRQALKNKPILSGLWLGGLLLKPQLLILILPAMLICRYWKTLYGFLVSFGVVLLSSILLSGLSGMKAMIHLWTGYSVGLASNNPEYMINWRMVGVNINSVSHTSAGWFVAGMGIVLTTSLVWLLIKHIPPYGTSAWVVTMLSVFTATLVITWHAHYHMALVLIPFFIYLLNNHLLPEKIISLWVIMTPIAWVGGAITGILLQKISNIQIDQLLIIAVSGFTINLLMTLFIFFQSSKTIRGSGDFVLPVRKHRMVSGKNERI